TRLIMQRSEVRYSTSRASTRWAKSIAPGPVISISRCPPRSMTAARSRSTLYSCDRASGAAEKRSGTVASPISPWTVPSGCVAARTFTMVPTFRIGDREHSFGGHLAAHPGGHAELGEPAAATGPLGGQRELVARDDRAPEAHRPDARQ